MQNSCLISVSTYEKSDALEGILKSLLNNDYGRFPTVICDDGAGKPYQVTRSGNDGHPAWRLPENEGKDSIDMPSAVDIYHKYKKEFSKLALVHGKERGGVAVNKNRGVYYYLEKTKLDYILLLDDDILFHAPGMVEEWIEVLKENTHEGPGARFSLNHLNGTWQDYDPGFFDKLRGRPMIESRKAWDADFPIEALGNRGLEWRRGSQGCACFYTRKAIEAIGYYDCYSKYAFEHSLMSSRALLKVDKRSPVLYPVWDASALFFIGNSISNNYNDSASEAEKADPFYQRRLNQEIGMGINLKVKAPGFNIKDLIILE